MTYTVTSSQWWLTTWRGTSPDQSASATGSGALLPKKQPPAPGRRRVQARTTLRSFCDVDAAIDTPLTLTDHGPSAGAASATRSPHADLPSSLRMLSRYPRVDVSRVPSLRIST